MILRGNANYTYCNLLVCTSEDKSFLKMTKKAPTRPAHHYKCSDRWLGSTPTKFDILITTIWYEEREQTWSNMLNSEAVGWWIVQITVLPWRVKLCNKLRHCFMATVSKPLKEIGACSFVLEVMIINYLNWAAHC